jgi:hypothetical protein
MNQLAQIRKRNYSQRRNLLILKKLSMLQKLKCNVDQIVGNLFLYLLPPKSFWVSARLNLKMN